MSRDIFTTQRTRFGNFSSIDNTKISTTRQLSRNETSEPTTRSGSTNSLVIFDEEPIDAMSNLPSEIGLNIFSFLDPVTAICLGLTNKKMYTFYLVHHDEKVVLNQFVVVDGEVVPLHGLMKNWGNEGWVYDGFCPGRFVRGAETILQRRKKYVDPNKPRRGTLGFFDFVVEVLLIPYHIYNMGELT